jgi:hypothetical protein
MEQRLILLELEGLEKLLREAKLIGGMALWVQQFGIIGQLQAKSLLRMRLQLLESIRRDYRSALQYVRDRRRH